MLARVMYQPARILVGYMQVITQIGKVLNVELPPMISQIIETFKLLAMSVKSVLQLDWCAHKSWWCLFLLPPSDLCRCCKQPGSRQLLRRVARARLCHPFLAGWLGMYAV